MNPFETRKITYSENFDVCSEHMGMRFEAKTLARLAVLRVLRLGNEREEESA